MPDTDQWPSASAPYELPDDTAANKQRWQQAIDTGLDAGKIRWTHIAADTYCLEGQCPRCAHQTDQVIEWVERVPAVAARDRSLARRQNQGVANEPAWKAVKGPDKKTVYWKCSCQEEHKQANGEARPESEAGCGWGRGLAVTVPKPEISHGD